MPEHVFVIGTDETELVAFEWLDLNANQSAATPIWIHSTDGERRERGAVAPDGEVYTGSDTSNSVWTIQFWKNSAWSDLRWRYRHHNDTGTTPKISRVAVDADIIAATGSLSNDTGSPNLRVLDHWGHVLYSRQVGAGEPDAVAIGPGGTVYVSEGTHLRKHDASGAEVWSRDYLGGAVMALAVDSAETVYAAGKNGSGETVFGAFDAAGSQVWLRNLGDGNPANVTLEDDGVVMSGTTREIDWQPERSMAKYSLADGADIWTYRPRDDASHNFNGYHTTLSDGSYLLGADVWDGSQSLRLHHISADGVGQWSAPHSLGTVRWIGSAVVPDRPDMPAPLSGTEIAYAYGSYFVLTADDPANTTADVRITSSLWVEKAHCADALKNLYGFDTSNGAGTFGKWLPDGTLVDAIDWAFGVSGVTPRFATFNDAAGHAVVCCARTDAGGGNVFSARAFDSDQFLVWQHDRGGGDANAVAADAAGAVYVAGDDNGSGQNIHKIDADGIELWARQYGGSGYEIDAVLATSDGGVLIAGLADFTRPWTIERYDAAGNQVWQTVMLGGRGERPALTSDGGSVWPARGFPFFWMDEAVTSMTKLSASGERQWQLAVPGNQTCLSDTEQGVIYTGTFSSQADGTFLRIDEQTGHVIERRTIDSDLASLTRIWVPPPDMPALPIPVGLGLPSFAILTHPIGVPIPLGLDEPTFSGTFYSEIASYPVGVPLGIRPADPRQELQYAGARLLPAVYRVGAIGNVVWHVSQVLARKTLGGLEVTATGPLAPGLPGHEGETLVIRAGLRVPDGTEVVDVLFSAPITRIRTRGGTATITAYQAADRGVSARTRRLRGIQYRASATGRTQVRCESDHYLMPGDTAVLPGGTSFAVREIAYVISNQVSTMDVSG